MKRIFITVAAGTIAALLFAANTSCTGQSVSSVSKKYLTALPSVAVSKKTQKYKMSAVYTNRDLYGNFTGKTMITGEFTRRFYGDSCKWNNVFISSSDNYSGIFPEGKSQGYIEDFRYVPSPKMLQPSVFKNFPPDPESVYSRNLIWDMMGIENFAWDFSDSLRLNKIYRIKDSGNAFAMADIGTYAHAEIQLCWTGISEMKGVLCAIIEFRAIDNKIELNMDPIKTKGTEQYWGTVWVSLSDRLIEHAEMYGGTIQEIEIAGMDNKFLVKTIRELWVDKIK
jgi:hypothetical protein